MRYISLLVILLLFSINTEAMTLDHAAFQVGKRFFSQGLYTEAEARFLDIVKKYPDSSYYRDALFYLGQTYAKLGKHKAALQYYRTMLNKSRTVKERQSALLGIAKSWLQLGSHDKAAEFYSFFAVEYPESSYAPAALYFAGIARERQDNVPAAIEKYRSVLELYPHSPYYEKSIEKVAVLGKDTPESLWQEGTSNTVLPLSSEGKVELFADDQFNIDEAPGFNATDFRAQAGGVVQQPLPVQPAAVTQFVVQHQPVVVTQFVQVANEPVFDESVSTSSSNVSNTNVQNTPSSQKALTEDDLEQYKKIWEQEFVSKLRDQELSQAENSVKEMFQVMEDKAQILQVKENSLLEKQNSIRSSFYQELKELEGVQATNLIRPAPSPRLAVPDSVGNTNVQMTNNVQMNTNVQMTNNTVVEDVPVQENENESADELQQYLNDYNYEEYQYE
ncbi:MAG: tetratricopeptide repeat protein [Brevinemataceae bacterium]